MDEHLYSLALKFLSRRPRSEREMRDFLSKKNKGVHKYQNSDITDLIIAKLKEQNFINDFEFAQWWFEQREKFRPKGRKVIVFELKQKGISDEILRKLETVNKESAREKEKQLISELLEKQIKKYSNSTHDKVRIKLFNYLARRGFNFDLINTCIDEIFRK